MRVVIDTNILRKAAVDNSWEHITVMVYVRDSHHITLDYEHKLFGEYEREVGSSSLFQKWYAEMVRGQRICYCSHHVPARHKRELCRLGFHGPEDCVLVGLAINGDKYIVTEDSDFGKGNQRRAQQNVEVLRYLCSEVGLTIHDADEARNQLGTYGV
jgi:predicted nucleic acid-binding protein